MWIPGLVVQLVFISPNVERSGACELCGDLPEWSGTSKTKLSSWYLQAWISASPVLFTTNQIIALFCRQHTVFLKATPSQNSFEEDRRAFHWCYRSRPPLFISTTWMLLALHRENQRVRRWDCRHQVFGSPPASGSLVPGSEPACWPTKIQGNHPPTPWANW